MPENATDPVFRYTGRNRQGSLTVLTCCSKTIGFRGFEGAAPYNSMTANAHEIDAGRFSYFLGKMLMNVRECICCKYVCRLRAEKAVILTGMK